MYDKYSVMQTRMLQTMSVVKDEVAEPDEASKYKKLKKPYKSMRESILNFVQYADAWVNPAIPGREGQVCNCSYQPHAIGRDTTKYNRIITSDIMLY